MPCKRMLLMIYTSLAPPAIFKIPNQLLGPRIARTEPELTTTHRTHILQESEKPPKSIYQHIPVSLSRIPGETILLFETSLRRRKSLLVDIVTINTFIVSYRSGKVGDLKPLGAVYST